MRCESRASRVESTYVEVILVDWRYHLDWWRRRTQKTFLSVYLSICLSICLSIYLSPPLPLSWAFNNQPQLNPYDLNVSTSRGSAMISTFEYFQSILSEIDWRTHTHTTFIRPLYLINTFLDPKDQSKRSMSDIRLLSFEPHSPPFDIQTISLLSSCPRLPPSGRQHCWFHAGWLFVFIDSRYCFCRSYPQFHAVILILQTTPYEDYYMQMSNTTNTTHTIHTIHTVILERVVISR